MSARELQFEQHDTWETCANWGLMFYLSISPTGL
jgi:hypothetical protein